MKSVMFVKPLSNKTILLILALLITSLAGAQITGPTVVKGRVTDAVTGEPLPLVAVVFAKTVTGTTTDTAGFFTLTGKKYSNKVQVSCLGYETLEVPVLTGQTQTVEVKLKPQTRQLTEVVVKPQKKRYRNKDNPAVSLINQVIGHKSLNRKEQLSTFRYEKYEKTQFALSNLTPEFKNRKYLRKFQFIFNNTDSTKIPGKEILTLYMKETLSDYYSRKEPESAQEVIKGIKMVTFEGYLNNQGMTEYLKYMYQDIDIYKNDITFLTNIFLSPIAVTAPTFYRYFIMDTVDVGSNRCFKLLFAPRNKTDMLFQGFLYITADSSYAVRKIELSVPAEINLNWAKEVKVTQEYARIGDQGWMLTDDFIGIDFGLTKNGVGIYGERAVSYRDMQLNIPISDKVFLQENPFETDSASRRDNAYWELHRHKPLSRSENGTYAMMDSVKQVPVFKSMMNIIMLLFAGYRDLGYFEFGPVSTFYSYNPVEGHRLRIGGRTTDALSKRLSVDSYVAYGFRDRQPKYYLGATLSLRKKSIWVFPVKSVRISYQDETKIPGQELQFVQEDNFLLSIKRGVNDKLLYNQIFKIEHLNEFHNHFSYTLGYQYMRQRAGGGLYFNAENYLQHVNTSHHLNISELSLSLRYARNESFYQGKQYRVPMASKYPVTQLTFTWGSKKLWNDYDYLNVKLSITKRFYLSVLGYMDAVFEAGKVIGKAPYPLLFIHRANQTYSYQINSYNLMNFLEFVSDEYVSLHIDQNFNGFLFNKIPLLKKLKWRECVSAKVLYGRVTSENDPLKQPDLFRFPVDDSGTPQTFTLKQRPYIEVSAGIGNILKLFRVEFVKRLTYLDHPNVAGFGIRARFKFDF